jgi:hypothetical protein
VRPLHARGRRRVPACLAVHAVGDAEPPGGRGPRGEAPRLVCEQQHRRAGVRFALGEAQHLLVCPRVPAHDAPVVVGAWLPVLGDPPCGPPHERLRCVGDARRTPVRLRQDGGVLRLDGAERLPRVRAAPPVDRLVVVADEAHLTHAGPRADEPGLGDGEVLGFVDPDLPRLERRRGGVQVGEPIDEVREVPQLVGRFVACPRGRRVPRARRPHSSRGVQRARATSSALDPVRLPPLVRERFACEPLGPARHLRRGPVVDVAPRAPPRRRG